MNNHAPFVFERLHTVPVPARKLFAVVVQQAFHGPIRPKAKGVATPPEILEACGLDVAEFYTLLAALSGAGLIQISNVYPFEEIRLAPEATGAEALAERCAREKIPFENVFVDLVPLPRENLLG